MAKIVSFAFLVLGAVSTAAPTGDVVRRLTHEEKHAAYVRSFDRCRHGHTGGVIVQLHHESPHTPAKYMQTLIAKGREGDVLREHLVYDTVLRAVAAHRLTNQSLHEILADEHTVAAHADCTIKLSLPHAPVLLGAPSKPAPAGGGGGGGGGGDVVRAADLSAEGVQAEKVQMARVLQKGVEVRDMGNPEHWNWGIDRVDSVKGMDDKYVFGQATGKGTRLYSVDAGVQQDHVDFQSVTGARVIPGYSPGCPTGEEEDCGTKWRNKAILTAQDVDVCDGHGTHTASTAAGNVYGVAKEATIIAVQGLNCEGEAADSLFLKAMDWSVQDAVKSGEPSVVALSLGADYSDLLNEGVQKATDAGVHVVIAAGNEGHATCDESPASAPTALSVGSMNEDSTFSSFSNYGKCTTLLAPGAGITAAFPVKGSTVGAATLSGTSMAAPHVSGAVLQLLQIAPTLKPMQVKQLLQCVSSKGQVTELSNGTPNRLLHAGKYLHSQHMQHMLSQQMLHELEASLDEDGVPKHITCKPRHADQQGGEEQHRHQQAKHETVRAQGALQP